MSADVAVRARLAPECELRACGDGRYERDCGRVWWGHGALHGGYVVGLAISALQHEVADRHQQLQHCTVQFLRPFGEGRFEARVSIERRGRSMLNATARLWSEGRLSGLVLASFGTRRPVGQLSGVAAPRVVPHDPAEAPTIPWFHVPTFDLVELQARLERTDAPGPLQVGGWVRPQAPEAIEHRYLAVLADLWPPAVYHVWPGDLSAQTVDLTYHARAALPRADLAPGTPMLVVLTTRGSTGGFVDEDVEIWTPEGELVAQARQMRYVHADPPEPRTG